MSKFGRGLGGVGIALLLACTSRAPDARDRPIVLATTTSTHDSGLLDQLIPVFEKNTGIQVKTVAVGTGQALELGRRGEADVLLVHAPEREIAFVSSGHGKNRRAVMHNDFVVVGPTSDPAKVTGTRDVAAAVAAIATSKSPWISRGDRSGTHIKELSVWQQANLEPKGEWYIVSGQGMGATLRIALEKNAYTLTDRGTYLSAQNLALQIMVQGDEKLFNPYHVIEVVGKHVNATGAAQLAAFFTRAATQKMIGDFQKGGSRLFYPDAMN